MMQKGLFIVFDGIDGCGKSTQVWKTAKYLSDKSKYNHIVVTREPYKNTEIRKILFEEEDPYTQARKLAQLYVEKDRMPHVDELIKPSLEKGFHVVSDRYSTATFAYQQAQGIAFDELIKMNYGIPIPDITFLVNVPVKTAVERMKNDRTRKAEQKFEKNIEFLEKVRQNYIDLTNNLPEYNFVIIDGTKSIDEIFELQIKPKLDELWNNEKNH